MADEEEVVVVAAAAVQEPEQGTDAGQGRAGKKAEDDGLDAADEQEVVSRVFQVMNKELIAQPLGEMFEGLGAHLHTLLEAKEELQEQLTPFFFGRGKQQFGFESSNARGLEFRTRDNPAPKPQERAPGDMEMQLEFSDTQEDMNGRKVAANRLSSYFSFGGMPTIDLISTVIRHMLQAAGAKGATGLHGQTFLKAMHKVFPDTHEFLDKVVFMDQTEMTVKTFDGVGGCGDALFCEISTYVNTRALKKSYHSVEHLLQHLKHYEFQMREGDWLAGRDDSQSAKDFEAEAATKPAMVSLRFENHGHNECFVRVFACLEQGKDHLLWVDPATQVPIVRDGRFAAVPFAMDEEQHFYAELNIKLRIYELGCASYKLPLIHMCLLKQARESAGKPETFKMQLLCFSPHNRLTLMALRPFINIDTMERLLMQSLDIDLGVHPKGSGSSSKTGNFELNFTVAIHPARAAVMKCMRFFMKAQLSRMDTLDFLADVLTPLGSDLVRFAKTADV
ncbi:Uncharacterized protein SCF082_LOCUS20262 [Durusdinium trenchii]|uniref:Uncharacterized protein n=1 Tax=Durusdinium trenchii TaxID=1381693 RepID=A0ABP0L296_9DINO